MQGSSLPRHWVDVDAGTRVSTPSRRAWIKNAGAVAEVLFASEAGPVPEQRIRWLQVELEDFLARVGGRSRLVFRVSLHAVSWVAPWMAWRPMLPLRRLSLHRRTVALQRYERSPLGLTLLAVKGMICILYYEHPDAAPLLGFDGACRGEGPS